MKPEEMIELHGLFHTLWTEDVGRDGYDKAQWKRLEELVGKAMNIVAGAPMGGWLGEAQRKVQCGS